MFVHECSANNARVESLLLSLFWRTGQQFCLSFDASRVQHPPIGTRKNDRPLRNIVPLNRFRRRFNGRNRRGKVWRRLCCRSFRTISNNVFKMKTDKTANDGLWCDSMWFDVIRCDFVRNETRTYHHGSPASCIIGRRQSVCNFFIGTYRKLCIFLITPRWRTIIVCLVKKKSHSSRPANNSKGNRRRRDGYRVTATRNDRFVYVVGVYARVILVIFHVNSHVNAWCVCVTFYKIRDEKKKTEQHKNYTLRAMTFDPPKTRTRHKVPPHMSLYIFIPHENLPRTVAVIRDIRVVGWSVIIHFIFLPHTPDNAPSTVLITDL